MGGWRKRVMGQKGFFDVERRLEAISAKGDPLEMIKKIVPWEDFRADVEAVTETKPEERKSNAGRKPYDTILKLKIVVLQSLHNLSDERTEYLIRDRISFMRFLDLELDDPVPDASTIWLFREALAQVGLIDKLFERFGQHLEAEGYIARGGQIIDATIVSVPKQRNRKEENEAIKAREDPTSPPIETMSSTIRRVLKERSRRHCVGAMQGGSSLNWRTSRPMPGVERMRRRSRRSRWRQSSALTRCSTSSATSTA